MRILQKACTLILALALLVPPLAAAQSPTAKDFRQTEATLAEYKAWLDQLGVNGAQYWLRIDSDRRPHQLFVGEGFMSANPTEQERFIEIFSRYLAGHPERSMLIDIYDAATGKMIGEYGFAGFNLFTSDRVSR
jgi:hypothetical protein